MKSVRHPIVQADDTFDRTITHGTLTIYMDTSYRPEHHRRQYGIMHSDFGEMKKGDKVYFHYLTLDEEPQLPPDKWLVQKEMIYCYIRDGKIHTLNDYIFVEIIKEKLPETSLILPESVTNKVSTTEGIVRHTHHPQLSPGDKVLFKELGAFENKIEGVTYYVMESREIIGKIID